LLKVSALLSRISNKRIHTRNCAKEHQVNKYENVAYEQNHEHKRVQEGGVHDLFAVVLVRVEQDVTVHEPSEHCPVHYRKCADVVAGLFIVKMREHENLDDLEGAPTEIDDEEPH